MKKRAMFLVGQNQYGVLSEMMGKLADYLEEKENYEIGRYEFEDLIHYTEDKQKGWEFIFSSFGAEFHLFSGVDGNKHVIWLVDHPLYHLSRFGDYADKDQVYIGCVDKSHVAYLKEKCGFQNSFFLPHIAWESRVRIPYQERKTEVFFPASYSCTADIMKENEQWLEGAVKVVVEKSIAYMLIHDNLTGAEGIAATLRELGETDCRELAEELQSKVGWYIDSCLRSSRREYLIRGLLENGISLTVCGRNWRRFRETLSPEQAARLEILSEDMPYGEIVDQMADSKIVLNIMPEFKDGTHERVVMSTMNGAVCVTDESRFLKEVYDSDRDIVYYNRKNAKELSDKIKWILSSSEAAQAIAASGKNVAETNFTAGNIGKWVRQSNVFG